LQWVPAHLGLMGNEQADRLSKLAAADGVPNDFKPFYSDFLPKFKITCFNHWIQHFNKKSKDKGIWYKIIQPEPPRVPWFNDPSIKRSYIKLVSRLRSGNYPSAKFAYLMKKSQSDKCLVCNKLEDVQHLLMECVKNKDQRASFMKEFNLNVLDVGLIQCILSDPKSEIAKKLCCLIPILH
jgi:hypothetical protein